MARSTFGGGSEDYVAKLGVNNAYEADPNATVTFYTDDPAKGGTQITDVLVNGAAATQVVSDARGYIGQFQGPDGVVELWASSDGGASGRFLYAAPTDGNVAAWVKDPATQTGGALSATFVGKVKTDGAWVTDAAMTSGSGVVTSASGGFKGAKVGQYVAVQGAAGSGHWLVSTIASVLSDTQVTANATATTTVSAREAAFGSETTSDVQAALNAGEARLAPLPYFTNVLTLPSVVELAGVGRASSLIALPGVNADLVTLADTTSGYGTVQRNFRLIGSRTAQTAASRGIYLTTSAAPNGTADGPYGGDPDPVHRIERVHVEDCNGDGVTAAGHTQETQMVGIMSYRNAGAGIIVGQDNRVTDCQAYWNDGVGIQAGVESRTSGCKSWRNGSHGFWAPAGTDKATMIGCMSEQNQNSGFCIAANRCKVIGSSISDGKNGTGAALTLDGALDGQFDIITDDWDGKIPVGVKFQNGADRSQIRLQLPSTGSSTTTPVSGSVATNSLEVCGSRNALEAPAYAASYTPNLMAGEAKAIILSGNITVNAPAFYWKGARITFIFTQDATGGRTVTWDTLFSPSWTPNTAGGKVNTISFIFDGSRFRQIAAMTA